MVRILCASKRAGGRAHHDRLLSIPPGQSPRLAALPGPNPAQHRDFKLLLQKAQLSGFTFHSLGHARDAAALEEREPQDSTPRCWAMQRSRRRWTRNLTSCRGSGERTVVATGWLHTRVCGWNPRGFRPSLPSQYRRQCPLVLVTRSLPSTPAFKYPHLYSAPQDVGLPGAPFTGLRRPASPPWIWDMRDPASGLRGTPLPRTPMNNREP